MITIKAPSGQTLTLHGDWQGQPAGTLIVDRTEGLPGGVPLRGDKTRRWGTGAVPDRVTRDGRTITLGGWAHPGRTASARVHEIAAALTGLWQDGDELGTLTTDHPDHRETQVQPDPAAAEWPGLDLTRAHLGWLYWTLPLWAPDPHLYGPTQEVLLRPVGTGVGLEYPLFGGGVLRFGAAVAAHQVLTNRGNAAAWPRFEVDITDPSGFRVHVGGRSITYVGACVAGAPVVVDTQTGRATVHGTDHSDRLVTREWVSIPPGGSVTAELHTLQGGPGHAWAHVKDTWI